MKFIFFIFLCITFSFSSIYDKTPSDVYSQAYLLKERIEHLRLEANVKDKFPNVGKQFNKEPRHVLQKTIEVLSKINKYRKIRDFGQISIPTYPSREITPTDVYDNVKRLNDEVGVLLIHNDMPDDYNKIEGENNIIVKFFKDKTPSDVYELLWNTSNAVDALLGIRGFTPTDVYSKSQIIVANAIYLRKSQGKFKKIKKSKVKDDLHPNHALNASRELLINIAKIEKKLWLKPTEIPLKANSVTTPTHVYDSLQHVIVEMQRVKSRLGIERYFEIKNSNEVKTSSDVVANLLYAKKLLPNFDFNNNLIQYDKKSLVKSSSEVFALTTNIIKKLEIIASYKGINTKINKPPYINNLSPKHVYQKAIEALEKTFKLRTQEGFFKSKIPTQPLRKITPSEVYEIVERLDSSITLLIQRNYDKSQKLYQHIIKKKRYIDKTPSDAYFNLSLISRSIDELTGTQYSPNETYVLALEIEKKIDTILGFFNIKIYFGDEKEFFNKNPKDVFEKTYTLFNTLKKVNKRANIHSANVKMPREKVITPNTNYNKLRLVTASLDEFQILYGIKNRVPIVFTKVKDKTPTDVYTIVNRANYKLNRILKNENY